MPDHKLEVLGKRLGIWKVVISYNAVKSMQKLARAGTFSIVQTRLQELASGVWPRGPSFAPRAGSPHQQERLRVPLVNTPCDKPIYILWQIDFGFDNAVNHERQILKIWGIGTKAEFQKIIDSIISIQESYTEEHLERCIQNPVKDAARTFIPWRPDDLTPSANAADQTTSETIDREALQLANRFFALTDTMLNTVLAKDLLAEFPLDVSEDEATIINHDTSSTLLLGRSGTGKTTCLVIKLFARFAASLKGDEGPLRQVLLTRSSELAVKLREYLRSLLRTTNANAGAEGPQHDAADQQDELEDLLDVPNIAFPLVYSFEDFINLIRRTLTRYEAMRQRRDQLEDEGEAEDQHVPWRPHEEPEHTQCVDLWSFKLDYWPKLQMDAPKEKPAELIFAEIMGVIKGSKGSREVLQPLSREEYLRLGARVAPNFSADMERPLVYDIFTKYQALKSQRQEEDGVDRVVKVIGKIRNGSEDLQALVTAIFDEFYVDEIQDLRCLDVELLLTLVKDGRAFHFAGDTAQTISQESHFRFEDIKAQFYDHFFPVAKQIKQDEIAQPRLFTLAKNYRSHQGIVRFASKIMEMLWTAFPDSVDKLPPEVGSFGGKIPDFVLGCTAQMLASHIGNLSTGSQPTLRFGADQVILVRDETTKRQVLENLKDQALILTILQSKGMEFEDVLLWEFFSNTPCSGGWRSLPLLIQKPDHFAKKYPRLCMELKLLYVAITRARTRLLIIEPEKQLATQLAEFLKTSDTVPLVDVTHASDDHFSGLLETLQSHASTPAEWSQRGQEFMQLRNYGSALFSFRQGNDHESERLAQAYIDAEKGRGALAAGQLDAARTYLRRAAEGFKARGERKEALQILKLMKAHEEAAELALEMEKRKEAAQLFESARIFDRAADCWNDLGSFNEAAEALRSGSLGEKLITHVTEHQADMQAVDIKRHSRYGLLLLKQGKLAKRTIKSAVQLLESVQNPERILISYGLWEPLLDLYKSRHDIQKLFSLHVKLGDLDAALKTLETVSDLHQCREIFIQKVRYVIDYGFAGAIFQRSSKTASTLRSTLKLTVGPAGSSLSRVSEWYSVFRAAIDEEGTLKMLEVVDALPDGLVKEVVQLHLLFRGQSIQTAERTSELPFLAMETALVVAKRLSSPSTTACDASVLLLTGVLSLEHSSSSYLLLPWSPLSKNVKPAKANDYLQAVTQWLLRQVSDAIMAFHTRAKDLWTLHLNDRSGRCLNFMTSDRCTFQGCTKTHQRLSQNDCKATLSILIKINTLFCGSMVLLYRQVMDADFSTCITGLRRHWLEKLLKELTFVSSFERNSATIAQFHARLLSPSPGSEVSAVASQIEDVLFYRMRENHRDDLNPSDLAEEIQISRMLGAKAQKRYHSAALKRLSILEMHGHPVFFQRQTIILLQQLERDIVHPDSKAFERNLMLFRSSFLEASTPEVRSFHAFTTKFEVLAFYLIIRCSVPTGSNMLIPQSWINLHFPRLAESVATCSSNQLSEIDIKTYRESLRDLTRDFANMIATLTPDEMADIDRGFTLDRSTYPPRLLNRRNVQLICVALANLIMAGAPPPDVEAAWRSVGSAISQRHLYASYLQHPVANRGRLLERLVRSFDVYEAKDFVNLIKANNSGGHFGILLQNLGVPFLTLDAVLAKAPKSAYISPGTSPKDTSFADKDYDVVSVQRIQRHWRKKARPAARQRRKMRVTNLDRLTLNLPAFFAEHAIEKPVRFLLLGKGIERLGTHIELCQVGERLQQDAVELQMVVPQNCIDKVGELIDRSTGVLEDLARVSHRMSVEQFSQLALEMNVSEGIQFFEGSEKVHKRARVDVQEIEKELQEFPRSA